MQGLPTGKAKPVRYARVPSLRPRINASQPQIPVNATHPMERITGRKLQAIRRRHLQQQPLCVQCKAKGRTVPATEIDHVVPLWNGGADVESNRQGLCDDCHEHKTAAESRLRSMVR